MLTNDDDRVEADSDSDKMSGYEMEPEERDSLPSIDLRDSSTEMGDSSRDIELGSDIVSGKRKLTLDVWAHFKRIKVDGCQYGECPEVAVFVKARRWQTRKVGSQEPKTFNEEETRRQLAMMVVLHDYPLSMVDHVGFREFVASFKSGFHMISRNTLKNDIMKIYGDEKVKCRKSLEKLKCRIAITTDMWTSSNSKKGFMAITGHYIDDSWVLQSCILSPNWMIQSMSDKMLRKFDKYWKTCHVMMGVAAVLDPRYKMILVEYYFQQIYGETSQSKIDEIRHNCYKLLSDYQSRAATMRSDSSSSSSRGSLGSMMRGGVFDVTNASTFDSLEGYDQFVASRFTTPASLTSELDVYLEESVLPRTQNFDVLSWWKVNGLKYPILQTMARDILAIPVSTVASESAFSTSGRLISPHRSRLHPSTVEALMCSRSWFWKEKNGK
ncbi:hypothetical protein BUALT_Bualt12G0101200 [Buddleja alternifolia]|uniref:Transposase n=1 Tax=Buddleja alternifolia TaxID=168488 RepID=A0AAV6WRE3_9LAMI|nr:hypothetical protein BUALT_Bualt12G0101200 [Buddleja alternifolia]